MTIKDVLREMREYAATLDKPMPKWADALEEAMREPVGEVVKLGSTTTVMLAVKPPDGTKLYALPPIDTREPTCRESADASTCPHLVTSDEGTSYCDLAESAVRERDAEIERLKQQLEATRAENSRLRKRRNEIDDEAEEYAEQVEVLRDALRRCLELMHSGGTWTLDEQKRFAALAKEDKP